MWYLLQCLGSLTKYGAYLIKYEEQVIQLAMQIS